MAGHFYLYPRILRTLAITKRAGLKPGVKRTSWITIISVLLAIGGFLVYKYGYLVYREYDYHALYDDVHGLQRSCPVMVNGVRVGEVSNIYIPDNKKNKVNVTLSINKKVAIPKGTIALLASKGLLGERMILLEPGPGPGIYKHNDMMTGMYDTSVMDMKDQLQPMIESAKYILNTADKNFTNFNQRIANGLVEETHQDIYSIERSMSSYSRHVSSISTSAEGILQSIGKFRQQSDKLAQTGNSLNEDIHEAEKSTAKFAAEPIQQSLDSLRNSVNTVNKKADELSASTTVNKALTNKKQYSSTTEELQKTDSSLRNMRKHPKGFSLIGGGK